KRARTFRRSSASSSILIPNAGRGHKRLRPAPRVSTSSGWSRRWRNCPRSRRTRTTGRKRRGFRAPIPQARVMKMGDGGFRPAYNVQFATDTESRIIVGVGVSNAGTDTAQLAPMLEQIERRTGKLPEQALVDGGFANFASLERVAADGV